MKPAISIVIPTKNGGDRFAEVLEMIFQQATDESFEVIVIDSGSTDETLSTARQYQLRLVQIKPEEFGHGRTRNLGAELARGEKVVFLTQDAVPASVDWLELLTRNLKGQAVAGVFGRQLSQDDTDVLQKYFLADTYPDCRLVKSASTMGTFTLRNIFFSNVNSAMPKCVWQEYPFDENLVMSEDQEWSKRVLTNGYQVVYDPEAAVYHWHNYSLISAFRRNFDSGASLRGIIEERVNRAMVYLAGYILGELAYVLKSGRLWAMPRLFLYEGSRTVGFFLGHKEPLLPLSLKRRLGWHKNYWDGQVARKAENTRQFIMNTHSKCDLCGSHEAQLLYTGRDRLSSSPDSELYSVIRCEACGLIRLAPQPSPDKLEELYPETYSPFSPSLTPNPSRLLLNLRAITNERRHRRVTRYKRGESLLDVGCGTGDFLNKMRSSGNWTTRGLEVNERAAAYARSERGLDVFTGDLANFPGQELTFDVITLWDVLEHLPHPSNYLAKVHRLLKRDGLLILTVPNIGGVEHQVFRQNWFPLEIPRHFYHLTMRTLTALLEKEGFQLVTLRTDPLDSYYTFLHSWGHLVPVGWAGKDIARKGMMGGWYAIGLAVCFFLAPLFLIVTLLRRGSILTVHARKAPERR